MMAPESRDAAYLWDILDAARSIQQFTTGVSCERYLGDLMMQRAVERALEIVGEAARRLSATFRDAHPEIPWRAIVGLRNILIHEYGEVIQDRLWIVATHEIPMLVRTIEPLLPPVPGAEA